MAVTGLSATSAALRSRTREVRSIQERTGVLAGAGT